MDELTQGLLRELFDYKDGELYWKQSGTGRKIGVPAGTVKSDGYRSIGINGKIYLTHRLIFLYHHDYLPEFLDHIDGNPLNNNILNLREATKQENAQNAKKYKFHNGKPTSSKFKGVSWNKRAKNGSLISRLAVKRNFSDITIQKLMRQKHISKPKLKHAVSLQGQIIIILNK